MDSGSESEDEVFFGPITEKEMMIRNQKGLSEDERSVENEEIFISEHFPTGEQNICSNHSLPVSVSHVNQVDTSHMSDEKVYSTHPIQQTSEWSESYYCGTLTQEHISDQNILYKSICEESNKNITCLESNYNQLESVDGQENGYVSDNLSTSITNAIHEGGNEYGEFDNTLRSIEELENSFTQVMLDGCETIDLSSVVRKTKMDPIDTNNVVSLTTSDESKNICFTVCGEGTGLFNTTGDTVVNDSCSSQLNNSVKVIDICNHVANLNHSNQNEFDSNSAVLSKINVEPVSSDSTLSFKTCNITNSGSTIVSIKSSESAFSEVQSSSSSDMHSSLVSDLEISSAAERNSIIKLHTDNRNTSEILFENLSINNSESVTNLQMDFDLCDTSNKSEKMSSYTSGVSKLFATDLSNRPCTTFSEKGDEVCDLKTPVSVKLKDNAQETNNLETIYNPQDQNEDMQNGESDILNIIGKTDFCNIENHDTEGNIYKKDIGTTSNNEVSVFSEVSQLNSVDTTTRENEPVSRDEAVYIFKTIETSIKEVDSSELSFEIMQKMNNKTPSEMNKYETDSFKDSLTKSSESTTEINVSKINEHVAISTENMIPQSDGEIIIEYTETDLKVQNNPDNISFKPSVLENIHTNLSFTETYGTRTNEILDADNTTSDLSFLAVEEMCKTACNVKNSYEDVTSNKNTITEIAYPSHDTTDVSVNICENVDELKDNFVNIASASLNDNLFSEGDNSTLSMTDSLIRPFFKSTEEEKGNFHDKNAQTFSNVISMKNENIYEGITGKSLQEENKLDISNYNEVDVSESYKMGRENQEEIGMKLTTVIDDGISKQEETEFEEPMDISYGDLSVKNTEQWTAYRHTIDLDASLLGDIITETEFKQALDSEEASFNTARSKDGNKCISDIDSVVADNGSSQKSSKKKVVTNSATKLPKQQKSLIKTPLFHRKTDALNVQRKALNLGSTKPSTADNQNTGAVKYSLSSEKTKLQKPSTAPKSSIHREPKSQHKLKQENTITPTAKRKIELIKPASSPNNLKRNERFKQIESPIRAYINNSPSSMTSKISSHGNDDRSLLDTKISKQEFSKSTEKKVSHIPMLRTPRLQLNTNIPKRKVDTTENVDPNRGSHKSTPRVKESPCSKLPRYDKFKKLSSTPLPKPHKLSEKESGSLVLQDKANYELHDPHASPNKE